MLSGAADAGRAVRAMAALDRELIRRDEGLALLFTPPFDATPRDPGYIKGYPPGLRENGGQYSHAAMWAILAFAQSKTNEPSRWKKKKKKKKANARSIAGLAPPP